MFQDIATMLLDPKAFKDTVDLFIERYKNKNISMVAGIEARGFIFGPPIALAIGAELVPKKKTRKIAWRVWLDLRHFLCDRSSQRSIPWSNARDITEMHVGTAEEGERALVVDDLIATGEHWSALGSP